MPTTVDYLAGHVVALTVDAVDLPATKGDVTRSVNTVKVTNAKSGGFQEVVAGIKSAKFSAECVVDAEALVNLEVGKTVSVAWTPTGGSPRSFDAVLNSIKDAFSVDGELTYAVEGESTGPFDVPAGP